MDGPDLATWTPVLAFRHFVAWRQAGVFGVDTRGKEPLQVNAAGADRQPYSHLRGNSLLTHLSVLCAVSCLETMLANEGIGYEECKDKGQHRKGIVTGAVEQARGQSSLFQPKEPVRGSKQQHGTEKQRASSKWPI